MSMKVASPFASYREISGAETAMEDVSGAEEVNPFVVDMNEGRAVSYESMPEPEVYDPRKHDSLLDFSKIREEGCSWGCFRSYMTPERIRIACILAVMIAAIVMFIITPETVELCQLDLVAVSSTSALDVPLDPSERLHFVEAAFD
eukprot:CAMPEP_0119123448 /NCGR_PEP_ID=MMETSP1310-20130426/3395_1 /TAXON_ID=464262 /ORGANISM="Genus nov. species nov., Strain RCC2339" /LENGTH=145 /DNA_ID=CAMNT_0007113267 /DNA_START=238 /DNA_END=672 /DNA_ORIENTATION=+